MSPKHLAEIPPQFKFYMSDGKVLSSLQELHQALQQISDNTYQYHANAQKNDFANWVGDIIKDPALAKKLKASKNRTQAIKEIAKKVKKHKK